MVFNCLDGSLISQILVQPICEPNPNTHFIYLRITDDSSTDPTNLPVCLVLQSAALFMLAT